MTTQLYLVNYTDDDGEDYDLFVSARDDLEALRLWREHWHLDQTADAVLIKVPEVSETARVHSWHTEVKAQ